MSEPASPPWPPAPLPATAAPPAQPGKSRPRQGRAAFWRGHRAAVLYSLAGAAMTATVAMSAHRWGPGGTKILVAVGFLAGEALLAAVTAAVVAAQWRLQGRRGGPSASWPLARQWAREYFGGHPLILAWWIPPAGIDPLQFPGAVNAAVFLITGNRAWITAPGVPAVTTEGAAWSALGGGAFMAAATAFVMFVAVDIARRDARLVARRAMHQARAGQP